MRNQSRLPVLLVLFVTCVLSINSKAIAQSNGGGATQPPMAEKKTKTTNIHGETLVDDYFWLREKSPSVQSYLQAEDAFAESAMKHTKGLQEKLYNEMLSHIKQTDTNVPYRNGNYFYYSRTEEGKQYPIYCRKKGSLEAAEEVILDQNELAKGQKFMSVGMFNPATMETCSHTALTTPATANTRCKLKICARANSS